MPFRFEHQSNIEYWAAEKYLDLFLCVVSENEPQCSTQRAC